MLKTVSEEYPQHNTKYARQIERCKKKNFFNNNNNKKIQITKSEGENRSRCKIQFGFIHSNKPRFLLRFFSRYELTSLAWNLLLRKSKSTLIRHNFTLQIQNIHDDRLIIRKSKKFLWFACQTSFELISYQFS